ncbi:MAG TPA: hypothetical protein VFK86_21635, partial [Bauldia sp.]|nr:hypothetical protein [Bauldia sp.]
YGTGVNPGALTVKDLTGMLSFGAGKSQPPIAYESRPPIVAPPDTGTLPPPGSGETVTNWPKDPDVLAREQQFANANKRTDTGSALVDPGFRLPKQKVEPYKEESLDDQLFSLTSNKKEQQKLFAQAKGGAAGKVDENGNPIRTALTEPPPEYRVPDPTAPEEFEDASKRGFGLFKKKRNAPRPSEMGGGTDDIANPTTTQ